MNEIKKPNDIFVATILNPNVSNLDLVQSDINPENTGFLSMDEYKQSKFVQEAFTKDGKFDNSSFEKAYVTAAKKYEDFTDEDFYKNLEKEVEYNALDIFRPLGSKTVDLSPELITISDPFKSKKGLSSLRSTTPSNLSVRELAQQSKIWDSKNEKWLEETPNDLGFFGNLMKDPLVYAQWDENGMHSDEMTGGLIRHKKGEYKTNDSGNFYTETLGNREIYGKQVISSFDLITKDTSIFNKVDFFDSDGKDKSAWGTTFKMAAKIAPFLIPRVAPVWGAVSAAMGLASVLPVVYKSFEGLLGITDESGYNNQTDLFKAMSQAEGYFGKFDQSASDKASQSMLNYESIGNMVGDVFAQIYQQRAAASLSKVLKSNDLTATELTEVNKFRTKFGQQLLTATEKGLVKDPMKFWKDAVNLNPAMKAISERQSALAKSLSLGYMALTSAEDVYGQAIEAGYDRQAAGLAFTASSAAMYGIMMNNGMGDWFLDKTTGYSLETSKAAMRKSFAPYLEEIQKAVTLMNSNKTAGKKAIGAVFEKIKKSTQNTFLGAIDGTESLWKNSIVESVEEMSEEASMDAIKASMDFLSSAGVFKKQGDFHMKEKFFTSETLQRYLTSAVGGFVGGALFEANSKYIEPAFNKKISKTPEEYSLINKIANGETESLIEEVNKMRTRLGNNYLSPVTMKIDGIDTPVSNEGSKTEGDIIADKLIQNIKYLDGILNQEGLKISDEDLFKKALLNQYMLPQIEATGVDKFILSDFNKLASDIHGLHTDLEEATKSNNTDNVSKLNSQLKEKREEVQKMLTGENAIKYLEKGLFTLIKDMHAPYLILDKLNYTKSKYKTEYQNLPDTGVVSKESVSKEFEEYKKNPSIANDLDVALAGFKEMQKIFSNPIEGYASSKYKDVRMKLFNELLNVRENFTMYGDLSKDIQTKESTAKLVSNAAEKTGDSNFTLEDTVGVDIFRNLENKLNLSQFTPEEIEFIKQTFQDISLKSFPLKSLSPDLLKEIVGIVNTKLTRQFTQNGEIPKIISTDGIEEGIYNDILLNYVVDNPDLEIDNEAFRQVRKELLGDFKDSIMFSESLFDTTVDNIVSPGGIFRPESFSKEEYDQIRQQSEIFTKQGLYTEFNKNYNETNSFDEAIKSTLDVRNKLADLLISKLGSIDGLSEDEMFDIINKQSELENLKIDKLDLNPNFKTTISKFDKVVKNKIIHKNPLLEVLRSFVISLDENTQTTIFDLLEEESNLLEKGSIEKYIKEGASYEMIEKGINAINAINSVVMGMYVKQSEGSPFGFNYAIKNYLDKYEGGKDSDKFAILEEGDTIEIIKELNLLREKLQFLLDLSNSNNISKVKEDGEIREIHNNIILKQLENLSNKLIHRGKPLLTRKDEILNNPTTTPEHKRMLLEENIYNSFKAIPEEEIDEFLNNLFNTENFNFDAVVNNGSENLGKSMVKISDYDLLVYLATTLSVNSKEFNERIFSIIDELDYKLAPLYSQEYAAKIQYGYSQNQKLYSFLETKLKPFVKGSKSLTFNISTLLGIGGAGKTTASGNLLLKLLIQNKDTNILISGPSDSQVNSLNVALFENLTAEEKKHLTANKLNKQNLIDKFLTYKDGSFYSKFSNEDMSKEGVRDLIAEITTESGSIRYDFVLNNSNFKKLDNYPNYIFIDEISHFNTLEIQLLNEIAKHYNISIFAYGDDSQMGANLLGIEGEYNINQILSVSPPKLELSLRASNSHIKTNNVQLMNISRRVNNAFDQATILADANTAAEKIISDNPVTLNYSVEKNELNGSKVVDSLNDLDLDLLVQNVNRLYDGSNKSKLGIVTLTGDEDAIVKKALLDRGLKEEDIIFYSVINTVKNPIQGKEHNFTLVLDIPLESQPFRNNFDHVHTQYKMVYTLLSRSLEGSIFVDNSGLLDGLNINNVQKRYSTPEKLTDELIDLAKNDRKIVLSLLTNNKKYEKPKPVEKPVEKNKKVITLKEGATENETETETIEKTTDNDFIELLNHDLNPVVKENLIDPFEEEISYTVSKTTNEKSEFLTSDKTFKYMFHPFYNRLGVTKSKNGYTNPGGDFDVQNFTNIDINDTQIKHFVNLKNRIVYYLDDYEGLKNSLEKNTELKQFIREKTAFKSIDNLVEAVKNKSYILSAKQYDKSIDLPAFKFELDETKLDGKILLTYALKIKVGNEFKYITLGAMSALDTYETFANGQIDKLDETKDAKAIQEFNSSIEKYKNLFGVIEQKLQTQKIVNLEIDANDKDNLITFTSGLRLVSANKLAKNKGVKTKISADKLTTEIPGLTIHHGKYDTIKGQKTINIFRGTDTNGYKAIFDVLKKYGYGEKDLSKYAKDPNRDDPWEEIKKLNNKPYLVVTLTDDKNDQFSKIMMLSPKNRSFETMVTEFGNMREEVIEQHVEGSVFNTLITKPDGAKLFYQLKHNILNLPNKKSEEKQYIWDTFIFNMKNLNVELYKKNKDPKKAEAKADSVNSKIDIMNQLNSFEEFKTKAQIISSEYQTLYYDQTFNIGKEILQVTANIKKQMSNDDSLIAKWTPFINEDGVEIQKIEAFYSPEAFLGYINTAGDKDEKGKVKKYYYNTRYAKVGNVEVGDAKVYYTEFNDLKNYEVSVIPEMQRAVINLKNTLDNIKEEGTITPEIIPEVVETPKVVETVEQIDDSNPWDKAVEISENNIEKLMETERFYEILNEIVDGFTSEISIDELESDLDAVTFENELINFKTQFKTLLIKSILDNETSINLSDNSIKNTDPVIEIINTLANVSDIFDEFTMLIPTIC